MLRVPPGTTVSVNSRRSMADRTAHRRRGDLRQHPCAPGIDRYRAIDAPHTEVIPANDDFDATRCARYSRATCCAASPAIHSDAARRWSVARWSAAPGMQSAPRRVRLSRQHARLIPTEEGIRIEDLGSTNGSFINDKRVQRGGPSLAMRSDSTPCASACWRRDRRTGASRRAERAPKVHAQLLSLGSGRRCRRALLGDLGDRAAALKAARQLPARWWRAQLHRRSIA